MIHAQRIVDTLLELTQTMRETDLLEDLLQAVSDAALDVIPGDHASLRILNSSGDTLLCGARSGDGIHQKPVTFVPGEGVLGWVVEYGRPALVTDSADDERFVEKEGQSFGIGSLVAVPIFSDGRTIGVLSVAAKSTRVFDDKDQLLAELLANCAVPHIARARRLRLLSGLAPVVDV